MQLCALPKVHHLFNLLLLSFLFPLLLVVNKDNKESFSLEMGMNILEPLEEDNMLRRGNSKFDLAYHDWMGEQERSSLQAVVARKIAY